MLQEVVNIILGSGIDFISRPISALFPAGRSQAAASISLVCDREVEGNEEFNLGLSVLLPASGVNIGSQSMATAIIMDATSERYNIASNCLCFS